MGIWNAPLRPSWEVEAYWPDRMRCGSILAHQCQSAGLRMSRGQRVLGIPGLDVGRWWRGLVMAFGALG